MASSTPVVVLGLGAIGASFDPMAKYDTPEKAQAFLNVFRKHGHKHLDTARAYSPGAPGTSEPLVGQTDFAEWAVLDTKLKGLQPGTQKAAMVTESIAESLEALKVPKTHVMYLHAPDRSTPFEETCRAMNEGYQAGKFEKFGLSNFNPAEVEQVVQICERNGWVKPSIYQGHYNAIARRPEEELLTVLRKHNMSYYAYSPGAGGMFSGKISSESVNSAGTRWDKNMRTGELYAAIYHKDALFHAANHVNEEAEKVGITGHGVALRWLLHHSALKGENGDGIIIGASSLEQLESNLQICAAGPLPANLVKIVDEVWPAAKADAPMAHF